MSLKQSEKTSRMILEHYEKYPLLEMQDLFKYIYQSSFGAEHLIFSSEFVTEHIKKEYENSDKASDASVDELDGEYSRVHLSVLGKGLRAETLGKLFFMSGKKELDGALRIEEKLASLKSLIEENKLPFDISEYNSAVAEWKKQGYPAVHHSEAFRKNYRPAYRVVSKRFLPFLRLFSMVDEMMSEKKRVILAIDGGSASGKTTLGEIFKEVYGAEIFHMDDFFLRPEQRTKDRFMEVGGNVDRERFLSEVLIPLSRNEIVEYRRFDCATMQIQPAEKKVPGRLAVIEGAYSMHPELSGYYDMSAFLDVSKALQKSRIAKRNSPAMAERFFKEWIPLEERYFEKTQINERTTLTIRIEE